ncbi:L,D-transpeptidase [Erythrobacter sp.]|uniref:L,D-transpeptidase family protein n=1 Tax=Erythrobacter sp. TaxID=1042 RepID=UPI0025E76A07|nr:L,D-transpeptidase family protein [Erythrobacter sp.]
MRSSLLTAAATLSILTLAACGSNDAGDDARETPRPTARADTNGADAMASRDPGSEPDPGMAQANNIPDPEDRPVMQAQVVLERLGFGPGVIDGKRGMSLSNAIAGFQESRDLPVTGELDEATRQALAQWDDIAATRVVTVPQDWGDIAFSEVPEDAAQQAQMKRLGYEDMAEKLAERFHTTPEVLAALNPGGRPAGSPASADAPGESGPRYNPGQQLRVPNVGADRIVASEVDNKDWLETLRSLGVGTDQPEVARILVDESEGWLKAYDRDDRLVALYTVTTGSRNDPLPVGDWQVTGVAYNPPFAYDPDLFWDVPDSAEDLQLPPGPNGPVGVVWIDLTKEHYGIHGTPAPETIGRAQSHGCVRLTNWDAARLAQMVSPETQVVFRK